MWKHEKDVELVLWLKSEGVVCEKVNSHMN